MSTPLRARLWLLLIVAAGALLRFYNLGWGAPYYHFHIDEHVVFAAADAMTRSMREAAMSPKFFMYSPGPMYLLVAVRKIYETVARHPLVLTVFHDEVTFMVIGRAMSAAFGTATIPVVYAIGRRIRPPSLVRSSGATSAGLLAAALTAFGVMHLRESHFFTVDVPMTFFSVVTLYWLMRVLEDGITWPRDLAVGASFAAALLCKYTAMFLAPVIGLAYALAAPQLDLRGIIVRSLRAIVPGVIAVVLFFAADPLPLLYFEKARTDIRDWVTAPLTGAWKPIWTAQFADVTWPHLYWFTNLLWWGLGPAFEIVGLAGVLWLFWKKQRAAAVAAAFAVAYFIVAGRTITPFARYAVPLVPALAITAGVLGADLLEGRRRRLGLVVNWITVGTTALWAFAYLHVFIAPDARLTASNWVMHHVPQGAKVLIEPSQNMVPFGEYLNHTDFNRDYLLRPSEHGGIRDDYYHFVALDTYVYLYDRRAPEDAKRAYIASRLAQVDYIVMDDTYLQFYQHLPEGPHAAVKKYYDDLFAGRLGFELMKSFKVYPSLFGVPINDDSAELTFRLFDHPRVFVFKRTGA